LSLPQQRKERPGLHKIVNPPREISHGEDF
jgi:hypothetical protein